MVVGDNGVLTNAQKAKITTDLAKEKEGVELAIASSYTEESNYSKIGLENLRNSISKEFGEEAKVEKNPDGTYTIKVIKSGNEYQITEKGTSLDVPVVTDEKPGELAGTGSEDDPYLIESIEDLVAFSHKVGNGESYENKYVKLATDLNFASSNSYVDPDCNGEQYGYEGKLKEAIDKDGFIPIGSTMQTLTEIESCEYKNIFRRRI